MVLIFTQEEKKESVVNVLTPDWLASVSLIRSSETAILNLFCPSSPPNLRTHISHGEKTLFDFRMPENRNGLQIGNIQYVALSFDFCRPANRKGPVGLPSLFGVEGQETYIKILTAFRTLQRMLIFTEMSTNNLF